MTATVAVIDYGSGNLRSVEKAVQAAARAGGGAQAVTTDDPEVIAGQATIGLELLRQAGPDLDAVFVAVGGAGLIAGVGAVVKALRPEVKVIAVEPEDADAS